jgi:prevent-host-death family protein
MRTISQRELRNDNASVMRAVEAGETFLVTKNGSPVAVVKPANDAELATGLPLARAARRGVDFRSWPRVASAVGSAEILDDLRGER